MNTARGSLACCLIACLVNIQLALGEPEPTGAASDFKLSPAAKIIFDVAKGHHMADKLWGIFFEEVCV